jgi:arginase
MSLAERIVDVRDLGDIREIQFVEEVDPHTGILDLDAWRRLITLIRHHLSNELGDDAIFLVLGGDCALVPGVLAALATDDQLTGLVYLDGHADYHTIETSPTGDPGDLVLAALTGRAGIDLHTFAPGIPRISDHDVAVIGIRSREQIDTTQIPVWDAPTFRRLGAQRVAQDASAGLTSCDRVWVHLDVDVFDPSLVPVIYPEPGGLHFDEVGQFLYHLSRLNRIVGMDVCCYHPALDADGSAGVHIASVVADVLDSISRST